MLTDQKYIYLYFHLISSEGEVKMLEAYSSESQD